MQLMLSVCKALKAMHQYRVGEATEEESISEYLRSTRIMMSATVSPITKCIRPM